MGGGSRDFQTSHQGRDASCVNCRSPEGSKTCVFHQGTALKSSREIGPGSTAFAVNDQFRVCFRWSAAGAEDVEIVDYH